MLKIAYVHTGEWPSLSPSFTFTTFNAFALAHEFEKCYFFIKRNSNKTPEAVLREFLNLEKPDKLFINDFKNFFKKSNFFYYRKVYNALVKLVENNELDAIVTRNSGFLPYLVKIKSKYNTPVFFETHDFYGDLSLRKHINIKKKRKQEMLETRNIPKISGVFCLQNSHKELYENTFKDTPVYLARTGIHAFHKSEEKKEYLTYVGSLDPHKGVQFLIKSLGKTKSQPHLLVIGGKHKNSIQGIKEIAKKYYSEEKVSITGWLKKDELYKYLAQTYLGIVPLEDNFFNRYLTSPLKMFDYYSFGIPILASDLPTTRELIEENKTGLFFEAGNAEDLSEKIDVLMDDKNKIDQMSENVYHTSKKFLWSERAKTIHNIVKEHVTGK